MTITPSELKRLNSLEPDFREQVIQLLDNLESLTETEWTIVQGRRTIEYQNSLYAQGRTKPGPIVTKAKGGQSAHNFGLAADLCPMKNGQLYWNASDKKFWEPLGMMAEGIGLTWGGHFKSILDKPHVESPDWKEVQAKWKSGELVIE